jgi:hypothetical protein
MTIPAYLPQKANVKAYYALEDVNDGSGNGFNLTNDSSVTFTAAKVLNGANLGATNSTKSLYILNNLGITGGAITISLWVKLLAEIGTGVWTFAMQADVTNDIYYTIFYDYNGGTRRLWIRRSKYGGADTSIYYTVTLGTANFYNIILTYDTANINCYLNGSLVAGPSAASGNGSGCLDMFRIGADIAGANLASALIDETIVWNVALSLPEVTKVYSMRAPGAAFLLNLV